MKQHGTQTIYLGIDVHKKTYSVTAVIDKQVVKRDTLPASPKGLATYCKKFFPEMTIYSAYEAGFCGFHLHRTLVEHGIENIVVHAASIEISARDRVKTDKRDSLKIAIQLSAGRLRCIHIPSKDQELYRHVSRLREKLVKDRTKIGVRIKSFLNLTGLANYGEDKRTNRKWIMELLNLTNDNEVVFYLHSLARIWIKIDDEVILVDKKLKEQASTQFDLDKIYKSVPGIGPTASRILINELGDMSQFKSEGSLFSFTGFTPQEYSSGEHIRQGHISRQGRPILRKILVQAAWKAIKKDSSLGEVFEQISAKRGKKIAIVAIARKLIGQIRACLRKNEKYSYKEAVTTNIVNT